MTTIALPIPSPKEKKEKPWFALSWSNEERAKMTPEALEITCLPGKIGMDSGAGFHAMPLGKFPAHHAILEYDVYFPQTLQWVKGGKLPGFGIGIKEETASGGDWEKKSGSVRLMWRENGQAIGYVYLPTDLSKNETRDGTIKVQNDEFQKAAEGALGKHAGIDLFFKKQAGLQFAKGAWNRVRLEIKMNSIRDDGTSKDDGFLSLTVNGKTRSIDGVLFRKDEDVQINMVLAQAFFGGGTKDWAAKKVEKICFRNFRIFAQ